MNDILIGNVLWMGMFVGAILCTMVATFMSYFITPDYPYLAMLFGLLLGGGIVRVTLEVVDSAITALMVCLCEEPATMQRHFPEVYEELRTRYGTDCAGIFQPTF